MTELKKSVKIKNTLYEVEVNEDGVIAEEYVYTMPGYGNGYGTGWQIELNYSKGWARAVIYCWNNTWGCRGHGMNDSWTDSTGYMRKGEAKEFIEKVKQKLIDAEDGTPDVKEVFDMVKEKVNEVCNYEEY